MLEHLIQDLRYAIRVLAKRPILLASTTISIGLGVGINVAVHSVLRTFLFQTGLPARAPDDLFNLEPDLSYPNYVDFRAHDAFVDLAARQASTLTYRTGDSTTTIGAQVVSENFFEVLGLPALTHAREVTVEGGTVTVRRETDDGVVTLTAELPAVVSVGEKINEPRYPSFKGIMAAKKKKVTTLSLADAGVDAAQVGAAGALSSVVAATPKPPKSAGEKVVDDGAGGTKVAAFLVAQKLI